MVIAARVKIDITKAKMLQKQRTEFITSEELEKAFRLSLTRGAVEGKRITPVGATANLKGSIVTQTAKGRRLKLEGSVVWKASYSGTVDQGGPPRKPGINRLKAWAGAVLGNSKAAFPVQRAIQRRGTPSPNHPSPGKGMTQRTEKAWQPHIDRLFAVAADNIARRLSS